MEEKKQGRFGKRGGGDARPHEYKVERVHQFEDGSITFNLKVDGYVDVYGCRIYDGEDGKPFVSFPSRKGKDGKYWNHVYFPLTPEQTEEIARQVEEKLA